MRSKAGYIAVCRAFFAIYIFGLCYLLFFAEILGFGRMHASGSYQYNLKLFSEIKRFWTYRNSLGFKAVFLNLAGNVIGFIPFGIFVPILFPKCKNIFLILLLTFILSFSFETIQLFFKVGSFDVDDLLLNTCGGVFGYIVYRLLTFRRAHGKE